MICLASRINSHIVNIWANPLSSEAASRIFPHASHSRRVNPLNIFKYRKFVILCSFIGKSIYLIFNWQLYLCEKVYNHRPSLKTKLVLSPLTCRSVAVNNTEGLVFVIPFGRSLLQFTLRGQEDNHLPVRVSPPAIC